MKKFFTLLAVMFLSYSLFAQEHLDFRGVPIDGQLTDFLSKMEAMGYSVASKDDNVVTMKGKFTNRDAELFIIATPVTKVVWKVIVDFDKATSWESLKSSYFEYKNLYITKYGKPKNDFEYFKKPYYEGDGYELQALRKEKCTYATYFETPNGYVAVKLTSFECLRIAYEDNINSELDTREKTSSALNEI